MRPAHPQLAATEQVVAEAAFGGDTAVLTDRRVVVAGHHSEQSLPLAHIALLRVRFERKAGEFAFGAVLVVAAFILFAVASPVRTFLIEQGAALEPAASQERASADANQGLARAMQRLLSGPASVARAIPFAGWLALAAGIAEMALGAIGHTVVTVGAGGSEVAFAKRGNDRMLREFVAEVGRRLPGPVRSERATAPALEPREIGRH